MFFPFILPFSWGLVDTQTNWRHSDPAGVELVRITCKGFAQGSYGQCLFILKPRLISQVQARSSWSVFFLPADCKVSTCAHFLPFITATRASPCWSSLRWIFGVGLLFSQLLSFLCSLKNKASRLLKMCNSFILGEKEAFTSIASKKNSKS